MSPRRVNHAGAERLIAAIRDTRIPAPPTDCLSPIGEERILASLDEQLDAEFSAAVTRPPAVYRGNPFQVEVGLACGGGTAGRRAGRRSSASPTACRCSTSRAPAP